PPDKPSPGVGVVRWTGPPPHNRRLGAHSNWASTLVFGNNWYSQGVPTTLAALVESSLELSSNTFFGRIEAFQRSGEDLSLEHEPGAAPGIATSVFTAGVLELGYVRHLGALGPLNFGIGAVGSVYALDSGLRPFYSGQQFPGAGMGFVRLWPAESHGSMAHSSMPHAM